MASECLHTCKSTFVLSDLGFLYPGAKGKLPVMISALPRSKPTVCDAVNAILICLLCADVRSEVMPVRGPPMTRSILPVSWPRCWALRPQRGAPHGRARGHWHLRAGMTGQLSCGAGWGGGRRANKFLRESGAPEAPGMCPGRVPPPRSVHGVSGIAKVARPPTWSRVSTTLCHMLQRTFKRPRDSVASHLGTMKEKVRSSSLISELLRDERRETLKELGGSGEKGWKEGAAWAGATVGSLGPGTHERAQPVARVGCPGCN